MKMYTLSNHEVKFGKINSYYNENLGKSLSMKNFLLWFEGFILTKGVKIEKEFLNVVVHFWNPEDHVFHFGPFMKEIYPTYEKFYALLGVTKLNDLIYPNIKQGYFNSMVDLLKLPKDKVTLMIEGS